MIKKVGAIKNYLLYSLVLFVAVSLGLNLYFIFDLKRISSPQFQNVKSSKVVRVIDGDTFTSADGVSIRLYEIDAPEYPKGCLGIDAKVRLEGLIFNKEVKIEEIKKDNFGRTLAYVYLEDLLINETIVEEGMAYFSRDKVISLHSLQIEKAQNKAKLTSRGIWSNLCQTKKEGCVIKGNYREADHTRIYHTPDCYNYDRITIKDGTSDRWFCSEEEALKAGFNKSLDCPN